MPFADHRVARALQIFIDRNEKVQKQISFACRGHSGAALDQQREETARAAYLEAFETQGTNPFDFALRYLAKSPAELEQMREQRRQELREQTGQCA